MRFITEFELNEQESSKISSFKSKGMMELGILLANSFGWEEGGETGLSLNAPILHKCKLEIEAFPMDKWIEFKQKLAIALPNDRKVMLMVVKAVEELESFGKPAGEAKELQNDH